MMNRSGYNYNGIFKNRPGAAPGVCRVCGCTHDRACDNGCTWVTNDLCSTCAEAIVAVSRWMQNAYRTPGARLIREAKELR